MKFCQEESDRGSGLQYLQEEQAWHSVLLRRSAKTQEDETRSVDYRKVIRYYEEGESMSRRKEGLKGMGKTKSKILRKPQMRNH